MGIFPGNTGQTAITKDASSEINCAWSSNIHEGTQKIWSDLISFEWFPSRIVTVSKAGSQLGLIYVGGATHQGTSLDQSNISL